MHTAKSGVSWPHMLAVGSVSHVDKSYLNHMTIHTAHKGKLTTSAKSAAREELESVVWAHADSAEKNRPAMVKRRMMK